VLSRRVHGCVNMGHLIPSSAGVKCRTPPRVQYREVHQQYTVGSSAITVLKLEDTVGGLGKRLYSYYFFSFEMECFGACGVFVRRHAYRMERK